MRRATIVGGGIGGLATAVALHRDGWAVTVHERGVALASEGTALGIWPDATSALDRIGLGDTLRAHSVRQGDGAIRRRTGRRLLRLGVDRIAGGEDLYLVPRPVLLGLLADALPAGVLRFDSPVDPNSALDPETDLLVAADGVRSVLRDRVDDRVRLRATGTVAYRGVTTIDTPPSGLVETWGGGIRFGVTPHGSTAERINWFAVLPVGEVRSADDDLALLRARFGDWADPIPAVLDGVARDGFLRHELVDLYPRPRRITDGRGLALVGDAAHAMTPDLGQGACQSLVDGVVLAESLRGVGVPDGLAAYDRARRRPTQRVAATAWAMHRLARLCASRL